MAKLLLFSVLLLSVAKYFDVYMETMPRSHILMLAITRNWQTKWGAMKHANLSIQKKEVNSHIYLLLNHCSPRSQCHYFLIPIFPQSFRSAVADGAWPLCKRPMQADRCRSDFEHE